ncbi:hypothetical protein AB0N89_03720 [Amycolatopsis sp. NPDC089917]|uniref:hypothetical protein n=1 Tax=Amycolatopsis sp. NPDC089917 TaxID=3155187 RepID=UPI00342D2879
MIRGGVTGFGGIFGPLIGTRPPSARSRRNNERQRQTLQKKIADAARKQDNLLRQAENAAPEDPFSHPRRRRRPSPAQLNLLAALPYLKANLRQAPADLLHRLLDLTKLTIKVHYQTDQATITATLPGDLDAITAIGDSASQEQCPGQTQCAFCLCPLPGSSVRT